MRLKNSNFSGGKKKINNFFSSLYKKGAKIADFPITLQHLAPYIEAILIEYFIYRE